MSSYQAIGGEPALTAAVDDFYRRLLGDPELTGYFTGVDLARLKGHQRSFLTYALGGPDSYRGRPLAEAHARLGITQPHFDRVVGHLVDTLTALSVPADIIGEIGGRLIPLQEDIVTSGAGPAV